MGIPVLIMGKSGSGKSSSMRTFTEGLGVINVLGKPLPFRNELKTFDSDDYNSIKKMLKAAKTDSIVIDDAGYLMTNQFMKGHSGTGKGSEIFAFYNQIGDSFWNLIQFIINELSENKIVYLMMHEDRNDFGDVKPKSIGKMLDEKVCVEGMFTVVIRCSGYKFFTQSTEGDVAKSPLGMFDSCEIDNDLKMVDTTIREYWGLSK